VFSKTHHYIYFLFNKAAENFKIITHMYSTEEMIEFQRPSKRRQFFTPLLRRVWKYAFLFFNEAYLLRVELVIRKLMVSLSSTVW
jgi:hypothetical protein